MVISIIIPVYNAEYFLNKCLNSIINQTYNRLEIIIVNDGSTDGSKEIIDTYSDEDERIIVIHKENGGIGSAYKVAFKIITGEYVLFVDSDDWLELNAIELLVNLSNKTNADMVLFGLREYDELGNIINTQEFKSLDEVKTSNTEILRLHFEYFKHPTLCRLWKRTLFHEIEVFEQNIGIDEMLAPQLIAKCQTAVYSSKILYNILIRVNSVSRNTYTDAKVLQTLKVYQFLCSFFAARLKEYDELIRIKYFIILYSLASQYLRGSLILSKEISDQLIIEYRKIYEIILKEKGLINKGVSEKVQMWLISKSIGLYKFLGLFYFLIKRK
jgi:glycosyltransferase involved in cell wall biosynthesis